MTKKSKAEELADFIEKHPNCEFAIDNDCWSIYDPNKIDENEDALELASDANFQWNTDWYSGSNLYGAGLAEAMVILLNRRGFNIKASAV